MEQVLKESEICYLKALTYCWLPCMKGDYLSNLGAHKFLRKNPWAPNLGWVQFPQAQKSNPSRLGTSKDQPNLLVVQKSKNEIMMQIIFFANVP